VAFVLVSSFHIFFWLRVLVRLSYKYSTFESSLKSSVVSYPQKNIDILEDVQRRAI